MVISTLDCKLSRICMDSEIHESIKLLNHKITEILWNMSIVANYIVLYLLDNNKDVPKLDRTFFFSIIYSITVEPYKAANEKTKKMMEYIKPAICEYMKTKPPKLSREYCSDILEVIIKAMPGT